MVAVTSNFIIDNNIKTGTKTDYKFVSQQLLAKFSRLNDHANKFAINKNMEAMNSVRMNKKRSYKYQPTVSKEIK